MIDPIATSVSACTRFARPPSVIVNVGCVIFAALLTLTVNAAVLEYSEPPLAIASVPIPFQRAFEEYASSVFCVFAIVNDMLAPTP